MLRTLLKAAWLLVVRRKGIRGFYDAFARDYDTLVGGQPQAAIAAGFLAEYLASKAPLHRMLELGCGTGLFTQRLLGLAEELHAVDLSGGQISQARLRVPQALLAQADVRELPYPDASFDAVVSFEVLPHFPLQERAFFAEAHRVLAPGGLLMVDPAWTLSTSPEDHARRSPTPGVTLRLALLRLTRIQTWVEVPTANELLGILEDVGFEIDGSAPAGRQRAFLIARKRHGLTRPQ